MDSLLQDLRYSFRMLVKNPGFAAVAVLTLGLGIGVNTAIFSFVDALLIRPLAFKDLDRLVMLWEGNSQTLDRENVSPADYVDWKNQNNLFEHLAAISWWDVNVTGDGEPERVQGFRVSPEFFDALDEKPLLGRILLRDEDQPGREHVAVLSYNLWQRRFASDPSIVGKTIMLDSGAFTVVGVMAQDFEWPTTAELWAPLAFSNEDLKARGVRYLRVMGRIKQEFTRDEAVAEMNVIAHRLEEQYPDTNKGMAANMARLPGQTSDDFARPFLLALMGAVGFVLLIACANVANLQLARATGRSKEISIRLALGATRSRIIRQLLTESVVVAVFGAAFGLLIAFWGADLIRTSIPPDEAKYITGLKHMGINGGALVFTIAIALLTGIISGIAPALQTSRPDLNETLKEGGRASSSKRGRLRSLLVVSEVALALVLLVGTGSMVKGFARMLQNQKQGFDPTGMLTMRVTLPHSKYKDPHQRAVFYDDLLQRIEALPNVESSGAVAAIPSSGNWLSTEFTIEGRPVQDPSDKIGADFQSVSAGYLRTMRIPLLSGREFGSQDGENTPLVVIISENLARKFWPTEDPIGKRIQLGTPPSTTRLLSIVGVAGDVKQFLFDKGPRLTLYVPFAQSPRSTMGLVLRTSGDPMSVLASVRAQVQSVDADQPIYEIKTMEKLIGDHVAGVRISAALMAVFGILALMLSAVGVYSVMAYAVTQRTREIGIRTALGAQPRDLLRLLVGQGMKPALIGAALGLAGSVALSRAMASLLFGVTASDPLTFVAVAALLICVALLACSIPARRAMKVDPMVALRHE
ncbi:MAG TPA: ABC transporter permease [Blastocatellia bacterium]|nr:ABC transporter permease [Blastocatellia bacterium]